jgi:hypothetical protein
MSGIKTLWASGFVNRWHSNPDPRLRNAMDTTAAHAQRVAILCDQLFPSEHKRHVVAAMYHDAAECITGDVPYLAKRNHPSLRASLDRAEDQFMADHCVTSWSDHFYAEIKLCDGLDAILFVQMVAPDLLTRDDFKDQCKGILDLAKSLGVDRDVTNLIGLDYVAKIDVSA